MPRNRSELLPEVTWAQMVYLRRWVRLHRSEPARSASGAYGTSGCVTEYLRLNGSEQEGIRKLSWSVRKAIVHAEKSK